MPSEIVALSNEHNLLLAGLVVGVAVGVAIEKIRSGMRRRAWLKRKQRWDQSPTPGKPFQPTPKSEPATFKQFDATDQLRVLSMGAGRRPTLKSPADDT